MPDDLDFNAKFLGLGSNIDPVGIVHQHSQIQEQRERAISAYRNNIALPDVYIADRTSDYQAPTVGEDGQEMTLERRAQLMKEAGASPMFDQQGNPTGAAYVTDAEQSVFDQVIQSERLGQSAEANREEIRVVQPRELDMLEIVGQDFDASTLASAEDDLFVPGSEVQMQRKVGCLYTSGCQDMADPDAMRRAIRDAIRAVYTQSGELRKGPVLCETSATGLAAAQYVMELSGIETRQPDRFLGILVRVDSSRRNELRFYGDPAFDQTRGSYASVFLCRKLYDQVAARFHDPHCDTTEMDVGTTDPADLESDDDK